MGANNWRENYGEGTNGEAFAEGEASAGQSQVYPYAEAASPVGVALPAEGIWGNFIDGDCPYCVAGFKNLGEGELRRVGGGFESRNGGVFDRKVELGLKRWSCSE